MEQTKPMLEVYFLVFVNRGFLKQLSLLLRKTKECAKQLNVDWEITEISKFSIPSCFRKWKVNHFAII
jgi:hypothetical protein